MYGAKLCALCLRARQAAECRKFNLERAKGKLHAKSPQGQHVWVRDASSVASAVVQPSSSNKFGINWHQSCDMLEKATLLHQPLNHIESVDLVFSQYIVIHCIHALLLYLHVISHVSQPFSTASPQLPQVAPPCRGNVKGFQLRLLRTDGPLSSSQMHAVAHKHSQVQGASVRVTRLVFPLDFQIMIRTNHIDKLYHFTISNDRNRISHHFVFGYR